MKKIIFACTAVFLFSCTKPQPIVKSNHQINDTACYKTSITNGSYVEWQIKQCIIEKVYFMDQDNRYVYDIKIISDTGNIITSSVKETDLENCIK